MNKEGRPYKREREQTDSDGCRSGESGDIEGQGEEFWEVREWAVVLDAEREERGTEARLQWVEL